MKKPLCMSRMMMLFLLPWLVGAAPPSTTAPGTAPASPAKAALIEHIDQFRAAALANNDQQFKDTSAAWTLPDADKRFKAIWGDAVGAQLASGYALWTRQYAGVAGSLLSESLRAPNFKVRIVELGVDRPARPGIEEQLIKGFGKNSPVLCLYLCADNHGWDVTWYPNTYFIREDEQFRALGAARYLEFAVPPATAPADPVANQQATMESFASMIDALDSACKRRDWQQVRHVTSLWRIPDDEKFFKAHWGEELGAKLTKEYAACANKYTNFARSEMGTRFWQGLEPKLEIIPADGKNLPRFLAAYVKATEGKSPIFLFKLMDPNAGRQAWGNVYFMYLDGAFRMIGLPEYMPSMKQG